MFSTGFAYDAPRIFTMGAWLTPTPSRKRPGYASASVRPPFAIAVASRAQMLAMPLAITSRSHAASSRPACAKISLLPSDSGIHRARSPRRSSSRT